MLKLRQSGNDGEAFKKWFEYVNYLNEITPKAKFEPKDFNRSKEFRELMEWMPDIDKLMPKIKLKPKDSK
jgi:hypothetical protein